MTLEDAEFLLGTSDFEEVYEEKVFEIKQFFVSQIIHPKLFKSRLKKLQSLNEAFEKLGGELVSLESQKLIVSGSTIVEVFDDYQKKLGELKRDLMLTADGQRIYSVVNQMIDLTYDYAIKWSVSNIECDNLTKLSEKFDPMDLFNATRKAKEENIIEFRQLAEIDRHNLLYREAKRLNLWTKMYLNHG